MGLLSRFDLSTDFTKFFLFGTIFFLALSLLLSWISPKNKEVRKRRGSKVDDRFVSADGELID